MECAVTVSPFCCRGARGARQVTWHGCNDLMHKKKIKHPSSLIRHPHAMPPTIATPMPPQHYSPTLMIFHVTTGTNTHNNCPFAAVVNQTQKIDCFPNLVKSVWPTAPSPLCSISLAAPSPGEGAAKLSLDYCIALCALHLSTSLNYSPPWHNGACSAHAHMYACYAIYTIHMQWLCQCNATQCNSLPCKAMRLMQDASQMQCNTAQCNALQCNAI